MKLFFRHLSQQVHLIICGFISFEKYLNYKEQLEREEELRKQQDHSSDNSQ